MKKIVLRDLKVGEKYFIVESSGFIDEVELTSISRTELAFGNYKTVETLTTEHYTCFNVKVESRYRSHPVVIHFNKKNALIERKKILVRKLEDVFSQQQDFLNKVKELDDLIFECNKEIIFEKML